MTELFAITTESELLCESHACQIDLERLRKARETARNWLLRAGLLCQCFVQAPGCQACSSCQACSNCSVQAPALTSIEAFAFPDQEEFLQAAVVEEISLDGMFERSAMCREYLLRLERLGLSCGCGVVGDYGKPIRISQGEKHYFTSRTRNLRFLHS